MTIYRMHRPKRSSGDYTGAMVAGGRWNPIGIPMLYTVEHLSLACLEVLVHLDIRIASVVIPEEFNVLLNPNHTAYASLVWNEARPFRFDPRLFAVEPQIL